MAQINTTLKRIFTIFNIIFAVIGGLIIGLALFCQLALQFRGHKLDSETSGFIILYVFGAVTMVIGILGAYGAHRESKVALIVFLVCMVIGSLLTFRAAIPAAILRPEIEGQLEQGFRKLLPLDTASMDTQNMVNDLQSEMHCCGLFSYEDWRNDIPTSCLCDEDGAEADECRPISYAMMMQKTIYSKPCLPILMRYILLGADIVLGVVWTLAVLALLGLILSSIMIHQMRYPNRPTIILTVPTVFTTPSPPKYEELHNPPGV